jgi:hypothetical protein
MPIFLSVPPQVLLCPPAGCGSTCRGNLIIEKDVSSCNADTSNATAIGTTYRLPFVVYDKGGLGAVVYRLIQVVSPCDQVGGQGLCNQRG